MKTMSVLIIAGMIITSAIIFSLFMVQSEKQFNIYITGIHTAAGYVYVNGNRATQIVDPIRNTFGNSIHVSKGTTVVLHVMNKDQDTSTVMDFNIDGFNVHINHLRYSQSQSVTFLADKKGIFTYYSNLHPEMNGTITIDPVDIH
ncbi:MAG: cupredoxin domain-containing protein [Thaumarchaeota archaeon]|nr:cupredoxin domain-containing protein [Candidatus Nitrosotalea sp.]MDE1813215.1 cupredoxin domain-containing protein [Nitrososphaerota archaeon]MDE1838664.1 cupredoxin domain-containing protein [Nitrososphaerota archaeon]